MSRSVCTLLFSAADRADPTMMDVTERMLVDTGSLNCSCCPATMV
jgi:hypothetical protein